MFKLSVFYNNILATLN